MVIAGYVKKTHTLIEESKAHMYTVVPSVVVSVLVSQVGVSNNHTCQLTSLNLSPPLIELSKKNCYVYDYTILCVFHCWTDLIKPLFLKLTDQSFHRQPTSFVYM